ncbi:hypothetical protein Tco_1330706, partial [Tanacetum coccineum]
FHFSILYIDTMCCDDIHSCLRLAFPPWRGVTRLGYAMPNELSVSLIFNSLNKNYDQFIQNYNMHSMGKTIAELHAILKLREKGIPKKAETPAISQDLTTT